MNLEERELAGTQAESLDAESQPPPAEAEAAEQPSSQPLFQTIEVPSQESGLAAEQPTAHARDLDSASTAAAACSTGSGRATHNRDLGSASTAETA